MDIQQLKCFAVFARTLNYSHAAEELYLSRQAVSKTVRSLESELGMLLVERRGNDLGLTFAGKRFAKDAEAMLQAFDDMVFRNSSVDKRRSLRGCDGESSIKLMSSFALLTSGMPTLLGDLKGFAEEYGGFGLSVSQGNSRQCWMQLLDGAVDASLIACMKRRFPECRQTLLCQAPFAAVMRKDNPLSSKSTLVPLDLKNQNLVLLSDYEFIYEPLLEECLAAGFALSPVHLIDEPELAGMAALEDQGLAIAHAHSAYAWPSGLTAVPFEDERLCWHLYFVYRGNNPKASSLAALERYLRGLDYSRIFQAD